MVEYSEMDDTFTALADPTRRAILNQLMAGPARVTDIAAPYSLSLNAISKHLKVLERARLIERHQQGRVVTISLSSEPMKEALDFLTQYRKFWTERLDNLERYIEEKRKKNKES